MRFDEKPNAVSAAAANAVWAAGTTFSGSHHP